MKNIEKLINECIKMEKSVVNDVFKVDVFKCKKELESYKKDQALQLQQTGVSGRSEQFYCWNVAVGEQMCNKQCEACKNDDRK